MREIILDTETTGLDPKSGHRIIEIGCLEIYRYVPTGRTYHVYLNPDRDVPAEAYSVHGISSEFLLDKPRFHEICDDFLEFIADDPLVIHNARFDLKFLNFELMNVNRKRIPLERAVDTLEIARRKFPGSPANLDALCRRFKVDNSNRKFHGALLDSELLAEVYLELKGGRQPDLELGANEYAGSEIVHINPKTRREPRLHVPSQDELSAHEDFLKQIKF